MSLTPPTVLIGATEYETLADLAFVDQYLEADPSADAWRALESDDTKGRDIVAGTRILNGLVWTGSKTDPDQLNAWPRTGISEVDDDVIPIDVAQANAELASAIANGIDVANMITTASTERRIKAGSVEVENFRGIGLAAYGLPLPKPAWDLIKHYFGGTGGTMGAKSGGTCGETVTYPGYGHTSGF